METNLFGEIKMKQKTWIYILTVIIILLFVFASYLIVKAQSKQIKLSWKKYYNTGVNSDASKILIYEIKKDSLGDWIRDIKLGETDIADTIFNFTYWEKPKINKYYSISAIDTAGNESELDGVDSLDFKAPDIQNILKKVEKIN